MNVVPMSRGGYRQTDYLSPSSYGTLIKFCPKPISQVCSYHLSAIFYTFDLCADSQVSQSQEFRRALRA